MSVSIINLDPDDFIRDSRTDINDNFVALGNAVNGILVSGVVSPNTTKGDITVRSTTDNARFAVGTNGQIVVADSSQTLGMKWTDDVRILGLTIDGGGSVVTTGQKGYIPDIPWDCTIVGYSIVADQVGSVNIEVDLHSGAIPNTTTDKISASAPMVLSSAQLSQNGSISGWSTQISSGDVMGFNVASAATILRVTIVIKVKRR